MKTLVVGMALCCSLMVGFGCMAERLWIPAGTITPMLAVDWTLAIICIIAVSSRSSG
jgi:hypothetical protein